MDYFRDIPCNKNVYKAYFVTHTYNIVVRNSNLFGAILLKWLNEDRIKIIAGNKEDILAAKIVLVLI